MLETSEKTFVAGHLGMVGSAIVRNLESKGFNNLITADKISLDLTDQKQVNDFFRSENIDQLYIAAAKVGGIYANNTYPYNFLLENLKIQNNIIDQSWKNNVKRLLFLGSSCIYPKHAEQPIIEDSLLNGSLEKTMSVLDKYLNNIEKVIKFS